MFSPVGSGQLTMVGSGADGVSSSSTFTFSEADSRILENTAYTADTSGFYVQWYSSGMDNSWGNTGDYSAGQLTQDGSVVTWFQAIQDAAGGGGGGGGGPVVRTRIHHQQLRMPSHDEYDAELAGEFATPALAVAGGATPGSLSVDGLPLEYIGVDLSMSTYGARGSGTGQMIVNKAKLDSDIAEMEDLIFDEETRALAAEGVLQNALDIQEAKEAAYEVSNNSALAVETARIDALLSGSSVDLDQLVELIAAYELADTDIISSIATLQADVNTNESDADDGFLYALNDRNMIQAELTDHKGAYASKMTSLDQEDIDIRADFASADVSAFSASVIREQVIQTELTSHKSAYDAKMVLLDQEDLDIRVDFAQADADALAASIVREDALDVALSADISAVSASLLSYETAHDALYASEVSARQTLEGEFDAYVISNDDALAVETGRIDALLSGSGVDLDQLVELVAAYELADTDIISSITNLQSDVDGNEQDGDADRALIRSEMAANETARDLSVPAAIAAQELLALAARNDIQDELTELKDGSSTLMSEVDTDVSNIKSDLVALHDRFQFGFLNPLDADYAPGEPFNLMVPGMDEMSTVIYITLNGLVMNPYSDVTWIATQSGNITGFTANVNLYEGDVIGCFGIKAYDLVS